MTEPEQAIGVTNGIHDRLPARDRLQLLAKCEKVQLLLHKILVEPGGVMGDIYFPVGACISLQEPTGGCALLEVALTGSEGLYGVAAALGVDTSSVRATVRGAGPAWRMDAESFRREVKRAPALRYLLDRYVHFFMTQITRSAACAHSHGLDQRVARWLLAAADRSHSSSIFVTHEALGDMLCARRVSITTAAQSLHARQLISYYRGDVSILDREGLERAACQCYRADLRTYETTLGAITTSALVPSYP